MADGDVTLVEGRREDRSGAQGHNIEFIAVAWVGVFENGAAPPRLAAAMQDFFPALDGAAAPALTPAQLYPD